MDQRSEPPSEDCCRVAGNESLQAGGGNHAPVKGKPVVPVRITKSGKWSRWMDQRAYLPCRGRPVTCRRDGCREVVADPRLRLCAGHLMAYRAEHVDVLDAELARPCGSGRRPGKDGRRVSAPVRAQGVKTLVHQ